MFFVKIKKISYENVILSSQLNKSEKECVIINIQKRIIMSVIADN